MWHRNSTNTLFIWSLLHTNILYALTSLSWILAPKDVVSWFSTAWNSTNQTSWMSPNMYTLTSDGLIVNVCSSVFLVNHDLHLPLGSNPVNQRYIPRQLAVENQYIDWLAWHTLYWIDASSQLEPFICGDGRGALLHSIINTDISSKVDGFVENFT